MPTEVYVHGINLVYILLPTFIMGLFVHHIVIPVFYELQIVSTYEVLAIKILDVTTRCRWLVSQSKRCQANKIKFYHFDDLFEIVSLMVCSLFSI